MSCSIPIAKPECLVCPCTTPLHCGGGQVQVGDPIVTAMCRDLERVGVPDAMLHRLPGTPDILVLDKQDKADVHISELNDIRDPC